jgi:hypothetical protein
VRPLKTLPLLALALLLVSLWTPAFAASIDAICPTPGQRCLDYDALAKLVDEEILPLPDGHPGPLVQPAAGWGAFGRPQPRAPVWNPPGPKRVGLQAGHYQAEDAADEYASLRRNPGAPGGGRIEWQVSIDVAQRAAEILRANGVEVDVLPTNISVRYRAHAFVAIHADGDESGRLRGYKTTRPNFSSIPEVDDQFDKIMYDEYGATTGLPDNSDYITGRMRNYYAFNARRYQHAVAPGVPQVIVETAFMSNAVDRDILFNHADVVAQGIANGVLRFLALDLT